MPNRKLILLLSFLLAGGQAAPGDAAKIYKWTDEQGNVSYHDRPPPGDAGKVEEKDIDPNRNVIETKIPSTAKKPAPAQAKPGGSQAGGKDVKQDESKRPKEPRGLTPAEQAAAAEGRTQQRGVAPTPGSPGAPAIPSPPPPLSPPPPTGPGGF